MVEWLLLAGQGCDGDGDSTSSALRCTRVETNFVPIILFGGNAPRALGGGGGGGASPLDPPPPPSSLMPQIIHQKPFIESIGNHVADHRRPGSRRPQSFLPVLRFHPGDFSHEQQRPNPQCFITDEGECCI
jgi:hypothetical protein